MSAPQVTGVTVFLTGYSGAGKSTIADALIAQLEGEGRPVTVLDGDVVRTHLSSELTFSREHRDLNIRRIGWVAGEIAVFTGISDPYEPPARAELVIDTSVTPLEESVARIRAEIDRT